MVVVGSTVVVLSTDVVEGGIVDVVTGSVVEVVVSIVVVLSTVVVVSSTVVVLGDILQAISHPGSRNHISSNSAFVIA